VITRERRIASVFAALLTALVIGACGYQDGDSQAVRVVAQAYLEAYSQRDAATVCRVIIPPLAANFAAEAGGSCERHIASTFTPWEAPVRLGPVKVMGATARVGVADQPGRFVGLVKYGSLWAVVSSWELR
jgi:hypothetical protein